MFVKVLFHGALKRICPDEYKVDVSTPAEAIRAVTNQFKDKLIRKDGQRFVCSVKECPRDVDLNSSLRSDELNIYPSFCASGGGKKPGVFQMVVGTILVVIGAVLLFYVPGGQAVGAFMMKMGGAIALSGLAQTLFPTKLPTANDSNNPESSKAFGNSGNTTKIGTRIPIGYGKYKVAGQYLSINTKAVDLFGDRIKVSSFLGKKKYINKYGVER